ncbi:uncharacterized protein KQ657_001479 [Scheffersomyces spartinae]|uniref:Cyclin-like domain-containing protein n=1 Tax=Scheffersomyces spartinae TaxID=45513 RepID=A0A9P7V7B3_9ASCO|nr:uncharacterized protein KQ657_001479 [Scheffersomyces spartinae]KAG7192698.1 hypothetical protein KQ657_001479 [Scheffersomyces spartinae]
MKRGFESIDNEIDRSNNDISNGNSQPQTSWIFLEECFLIKSPSRKAMNLEQDLKTREAIHDFIIKLGTQLRVDGRTILAATIYLNRFYMRLPITSSKYFVASAAMSISCKLNDTYRPPEKIALVACTIKNPRITVDTQSEIYWQWRDQLLFREELMLKNLNFDLDIELPYEIRNEIVEKETEEIENKKRDDDEEKSTFDKNEVDILKQTVSLTEMLSSLPIFVAYNMRQVFGCCLIIVLHEGSKKFKWDIQLPSDYLKYKVDVDVEGCFKCFSYIHVLLKHCLSKHPQLLSHKPLIKRIPQLSREEFFKYANV